MKLNPPLLLRSDLTGCVYIVTHGKERPNPNGTSKPIIEASVKYDVTAQFNTLARERQAALNRAYGTTHRENAP